MRDISVTRSKLKSCVTPDDLDIVSKKHLRPGRSRRAAKSRLLLVHPLFFLWSSALVDLHQRNRAISTAIGRYSQMTENFGRGIGEICLKLLHQPSVHGR